MRNYYGKELHRLFMNRSTVHEEVELNDLKKHNKGELILCLFLKVPTGPRLDGETEKDSVRKHLKGKHFKGRN